MQVGVDVVRGPGAAVGPDDDRLLRDVHEAHGGVDGRQGREQQAFTASSLVPGAAMYSSMTWMKVRISFNNVRLRTAALRWRTRVTPLLIKAILSRLV